MNWFHRASPSAGTLGSPRVVSAVLAASSMANVTAYIKNLRKVGDVSRIDHPTTLISRMNAPTTRWRGF
jgi:hypothetical protein